MQNISIDDEEPQEEKKVLPPLEDVNLSYNLNSPAEILHAIDDIQAKYFRLIKRSDILLQVFNYDEHDEEKEHLDKLFLEVEKYIDKDDYYLQKYKNIEKTYKSKIGKTTIEINDIEAAHYKEVDNLLNEVYQEVKTRIPEDDFKQLIKSELRWLKEVENYNKVFRSQEYGTIGTYVGYSYEINMRNFRTLLLMLYLQ